MRALVCGGRDFSDYVGMCRFLDNLAITTIIEGGAPGADRLAKRYADESEKTVLEFQAPWAGYGRAAGPIRNQRMLDEGKPNIVIAFPGGRGTADMVRRAKAAGIKVVEVSRSHTVEGVG